MYAWWQNSDIKFDNTERLCAQNVKFSPRTPKFRSTESFSAPPDSFVAHTMKSEKKDGLEFAYFHLIKRRNDSGAMRHRRKFAAHTLSRRQRTFREEVKSRNPKPEMPRFAYMLLMLASLNKNRTQMQKKKFTIDAKGETPASRVSDRSFPQNAFAVSEKECRTRLKLSTLLNVSRETTFL